MPMMSKRIKANRELMAKHPGPRGTFATVEPLDPEERVGEIARMLGGLKLTDATRRHAAEMLQNARSARTPSRKDKGKDKDKKSKD